METKLQNEYKSRKTVVERWIRPQKHIMHELVNDFLFYISELCIDSSFSLEWKLCTYADTEKKTQKKIEKEIRCK